MKLSSKCIELFACFGAVLGFLFVTPATNATITVTGEPVCFDGISAGTCDTGLSPPVPFAFGPTNGTADIDIVLSTQHHIELLDSDAENEKFSLFLNVSNTTGTDASITYDFDLSDENGNIIFDGPSNNFTLQTGFILQGLNTFFEAPDNIIFHDIHLSLQSSVDLSGTMSVVRFSDFDPESNVGEWQIPEPATLALLALGLAGFCFVQQRMKGVSN